ncbi:serine/threonine-protein kinase [Streptomyces sp. DH7]|uniref:serine/threonine-protein kinase n=1 Tax=Streptomyces sp. DH7 TaxID=2857006 RepID=UPI001E604F6D|nr:serine/threonine-protein kinase [Streptomyces sp. DH7]
MGTTQPGDVIGGRYRLAAELGAGGFGRVWRAYDETLGVDVAIKELRLVPAMSEADQADRLARATREARNAVRLRRHEGIVTIYDVVVKDDLPWIVMELIDGRSLSEHIDEIGPLSVDRAVDVAVSLLTAIGAAHEEGVVHRDIKPGNVMLAGGGKTLLTDFGIAVHDTDTVLTATGMIVGSAEYMAPERLRGTDGLPASDLFSLGATLYQAVEGVSPFHRATRDATLAAVLLEEAPVPQRAGRLTQLITRLLDKDPDSRPTVVEALAIIRGQQPTQVQVRPQVHIRHDTRFLPAPRATTNWGYQAIAVIMVLIAALGVAGLPDAGPTWGRVETDIRVVVAVFDVFAGGLLCASLARFVPAVAGRAITFLSKVAGFGFGCFAAGFAVHGAAKTLRDSMGVIAQEDDAATASLTVLTVAVLVAAALAWQGRRPRRHQPR